MKQTGIVLQGGGALGAYEFGALKRLYENHQFSPDIISGVSIGAINAIALVGAREEPISTLEAMWEELSVFPFPFSEKLTSYLALFGNQSFSICAQTIGTWLIGRVFILLSLYSNY